MILFAFLFGATFLLGVFFGLLLAREHRIWRAAKSVGELDFTGSRRFVE